ncbi:MAG: cytochrome b/b6 domain-containing protein [Infirmifilum sp.]
MSEEKKIEVMSLSYRLVHTHNLHFIAFLTITGVILLLPNLFGWLAQAIGMPLATYLGTPPESAGASLALVLHVAIGFLWGAMLILYALYLLYTRNIRVFDSLKKPLGKQIREAKALAGRYMLGKPIPPEVLEEMERHNVLVAYTFIILLVGVILVSISGVALAFRNYLPVETFRTMLLMHDVGFGLIMLFLLLHLYASLHPANRPVLHAMFTDGMMTIKELEEHMKSYLKRFSK